MNKVDEAIGKIRELADGNFPVVIFPYLSRNRESALSIRHYSDSETKWPKLPECQIEWNLNKNEVSELREKLGITLRHSIIVEEKGECGRYYEFHWAYPTNISEAVWHVVGWEYECAGIENDFIVVSFVNTKI